MPKMNKVFITVLFLLLSMEMGFAQADPQQIIVPISRPNEPITLDISILSAHIEVIGEERKDAEFNVSVTKGGKKIITPSGTKVVAGGSYALDIEEHDNHISVDTDWGPTRVKIVARIPQEANLELSTTNDGVIVVDNVNGNLQLANVNGPITGTNLSGSVIAESVNEDINLDFQAFAADDTMSLTSVNGDLSIALPDRAKAQLRIDTARGEIYSDFEVEVEPSSPVVQRNQGQSTFEVRVENVIVANVNGGGGVVKLKTLNGDIQVRKSN
ncbi:MAG: DUF4097 family beta strand repeat-containing protein [Pseudomonadota bacterium]